MSNEAEGQGRGGGAAATGAKRRGLMLIVSSPSGAGKTTLTRALLAAEGDRCRLSISATTRSPRPGEIEGVHYFFLDRVSFEERCAAGEFLEWAEVFGNLYGTPKAAIENTLRDGRDVVFDIDWQGARQLSANAPSDVVRIFILPPSHSALEQRLRARAADSNDIVARRLAGASEEIRHWDEYDYVIINDDLDESVAALRCVIAAERLKRVRFPALAEFVQGLLREE